MIRSLVGGVPGTVVVTSLAVLGSFVVIRKFYPHFIPLSPHNKTTTTADDHSSDDSDNGHDQQVPGTGSGASDDLTVGHFPWEPNYRRDTDNSTKPALQHRNGVGLLLGRDESKTTPSQSCHEQLNFLASMTFANGGIRAPSCPCCV